MFQTMLPHALFVFIPLNVRIILAFCCHHRNLILESLTLVLDNHRPAILLICQRKIGQQHCGHVFDLQQSLSSPLPAVALPEAMRERKMTKKTKTNWTVQNSPPWRSALMALQLQLVLLLLPVLRQEGPSRGVRVPTHPYESVRHLHVPFGGRPLCAAERAQGVHWQDPKRAASHRRSSVMCLTARQRTMPPPDAQALKPLMLEFVDLRSRSPSDHCFHKHQQWLSVLFAEEFGIGSHSSVSTTTKPCQDPTSMSKHP